MITPFVKAVVLASLLVVAVGLGFAPKEQATKPAAHLDTPAVSTGV